MKKLLSLLLCLALLALPTLTLAETAELNQYVNEDGYYSFSYPALWTLLSPENATEVFDAGASLIEDEALLAALQQARATVEQNGMTILMSPGGTSNINVIAQSVGGTVSANDILAMSDSFIQPISDALPGFEIVDAATVIDDFGENQYMGFTYSYDMAGTKLFGAQFYTCPKTALVVITFTCPESDQDTYAPSLGAILSSMSF